MAPCENGELAQAIERGIDFLYRSQLPHGEFRTWASSDEALEDNCVFDSSPFVTSLVLYALGHVDGPRVQEMMARGLDFLQEEMEPPGLWRYWSARNEQHWLLPPDLDDTCCISFVLRENDRPVPANQAIILANRNDAGLFYTWLLPRPGAAAQPASAPKTATDLAGLLTVARFGAVEHVDCVANVNALLYLGWNKATRAAADHLIDLVRSEREGTCSDFYPHSLSFYYMLSRAFRHSVEAFGELAPLARARIRRLQRTDGSFGNEHWTALAVCALLNFGAQPAALQPAVSHLLDRQRDDGSWPRCAAFLGPAPYYGSEELTTAFCIEALAWTPRLVNIR